MQPIVTLTTDFGYGAYVAQIKAVLLGYRRDQQIIDLAHDIPPQDILYAATVLADASTRFPSESYHIAIVDPGVGTDRKLVYVEAGSWRYLLPDNGLIGIVAAQWPVQRVIQLTQSRFWAPKIAPTFHGRDIIAHVVGHLLQGIDPLDLGELRQELVQLPLDAPRVVGRRLLGEIGFIDHFGNLVSNISRDDLSQLLGFHADEKCEASVRIQGIDHVPSWSNTYGSRASGTLIALFSSQDRLEIAVVNGNAAQALGLSIHHPIEVVIR